MTRNTLRVSLWVSIIARRNIALANKCNDLVLRSIKRFYISVHRVSGHAGNAGHECADIAAYLGTECNVPSFSHTREFSLQRLLNAPHGLSRIAESLHGVFCPVSVGVVCCSFQLVVRCIILLPCNFLSIQLRFFRSSALLRVKKCLMRMFGSPPTIPTHSGRMRWCRPIGKKSLNHGRGGPASFYLLAVSLMLLPARPGHTQLSQQPPRGQLFLQLPRGLAIAAPNVLA